MGILPDVPMAARNERNERNERVMEMGAAGR